MKLEDRFFPRVWDGERYWYPCFSELGITYEAEDLPFIEENIKSLDWALGWHFPQNGDDLEFNHIVEACTGLKDKNGKLIFNYHGKPIKSISRSWHSVFYKFIPADKVSPDDVIENRLIKNRNTGKLERVTYKRVLKDPSLPYTDFYTLRHTAATWILKETNNLRITQQILGHADIKTTLKYAHVLDEEKRNALNSVFN